MAKADCLGPRGPRRLLGMRAAAALVAITGCGFQPVALTHDASMFDGSVDAHVDVMVDAGFTVADCPTAYDRQAQSVPGSRYRIVTTSATYRLQHADCENDTSGFTHLAAIESVDELSAIRSMLPGPYTYVGGVQLPGQSGPSDNWRWITGTPVTISWALTPRAQPEDGDTMENDAENIVLVAAGGLHDETGIRAYPAICECDGIAIDASLITAIP